MSKLNKVNLATATTVNTTYAGQFAGEYIAAALLSSSTVNDGGLTVKANIALKEVIKTLKTGDIVTAAGCSFVPNSSVTLDERIIEPIELQVNLELCKYKFVKDWEAQSMGFGLSALVASVIPLFNLLLLPATVIGGTLLWCRRYSLKPNS
jgi:hypothetical protein